MSFSTSIVVTFISDKFVQRLPKVKAILESTSVHSIIASCYTDKIVFEILQGIYRYWVV